MKALALAALAALLLAPGALAAPPAVTASASAPRGLAPFAVTLTAAGDEAAHTWSLGDGTVASGASVRHVYDEPGTYVATVTAVSPTGEARSASVTVTAHRLAFEAPARGAYGERGRFSGSIWPPLPGATVDVLGPRSGVARGRLGANGGFVLRGRLLSRGPFRARVSGFESRPATVALRPRIEARLAGSGLVGEPLRVEARLVPAAAGTLVVEAAGRSARGPAIRLALPTGRVASHRVDLRVEPAEGYVPARRSLTAAVARPNLGRGARGPSVLALERRLRALRYALPAVDATYGLETVQAVLAFQAVTGLPRTGRLDARTWRALGRASTPVPRRRGTHIEVSKGRQYLLTVEGGRVTNVVHVSTGATGNTPIGSFRIYRKVVGWDWVLWYPLYFLRGFAIHGYPEVPAYPASHGCVRVPMWIAPSIHRRFAHGQAVHVYW